jgi:hypothetical protein
MSNKLYPDQEIDQKEGQINYYKRTTAELLSIPPDYFEAIKQRLGSEFREVYVEKSTCMRVCAITLTQLKSLKLQMDSFKEQLAKVQMINEQTKVVVLEEVSKEEGKTLVEEYFKVHECADIEELMLNLKIPVRSIVEIIDELQKEGKLTPKDENET